MRLLSLREHTSSIVVAALSSAFGVALLQLTNNMAVALTRDDEFGQAALLALMLNMLAVVFIAISVYVGAIVTANAFSTIIAGRTRTIALVRLIGGSARSQRRQIAGEGLMVGVIGSLVGAGAGIVAAAGIFQFAQGADALPAINYSYFDLIALAPIVGVIVTTWAAAWAGSRRVLSVTPMQALGASVDSIDDSPTHSIRRLALSTVMVGIGLGLTVVGMLVGLTFAPGVLISLVGGIISFTGFVLGAQFVMPQVLRFIGARIGRGSAARSLQKIRCGTQSAARGSPRG
ncbi:FtsX-like permease family protein [Salinibacterium sp. PAMC 21357]|uniref:FtsX-like permease family protein n=1 Tax=Salinibacterium sp. PAMC 21357 TaxID=1112215 RepID=UPI0002E8FA0A|nr:FtsX-like permease family protein [Salinibacterium sp. PAMC 21357]